MTLTMTATPFSFDSPPRMQLDITSTTAAPNGVDPFAHFTVKRTDNDGRARNMIMAPDPQLTSGGWSGNDFHCPFNEAATYTVLSGTASGTSAEAVLTPPAPWIIHRSNPSLAVQIDGIADIGDRSSPSTAAVHWPLQARFPVTKSQGVRRARSGQLVINCDSPANEGALLSLLADSGTVLLNLNTQPSAWWDESWAWIQPLDVAQSNPAGWRDYDSRTISFPYQVVDTPAAAIIPTWTYEMLKAEFTSYAQLPQVFASYAELAANHRTA